MLRTLLARAGRRAIAALRRPWISALLMLVLLIDGCTLPYGSRVGRNLSLGITRCGCRLGPYGYWTEAAVTRDAQGALVWQGPGSARDVPEDSIVATIMCSPRPQRRGLWAVTREMWDPTITIAPGPASSATTFTPEETQRLRLEYADLVEQEKWSPRADYADLMRAGAGQVTRIMWSGYIHNMISAALATAMILSFGWVRDRARARRAKLALLTGFCPTCEYDLRGQHDHGCPECGWQRGSNGPA